MGKNGGCCIMRGATHDIPYTENNAWLAQIIDGVEEGENLLAFFPQPEYHASGLQVNLQDSACSNPLATGSYAPYLGSHACLSLPASGWSVQE